MVWVENFRKICQSVEIIFLVKKSSKRKPTLKQGSLKAQSIVPCLDEYSIRQFDK